MSLLLLCLFRQEFFALAQLNWGNSRPSWSGAGVNVNMSFPQISFIRLLRKICPFAFSLSVFLFSAFPVPIMFPKFVTCRVVNLNLTWWLIIYSIFLLAIARSLCIFFFVSCRFNIGRGFIHVSSRLALNLRCAAF